MKQLTHEEIQAYLLDILKDVDAWCRAHDIRYSMAYGTLLGAVRHKGFIPWDDDIDLLMPRPDFERFVAGYGNARYQCLYGTRNGQADFVNFFAKVHDTHTRSHENGKYYRFGLNIDVFPVDGKPDNPADQLAWEKKMHSLTHRLRLRYKPLFSHPLIGVLSAHRHSLTWWQQRCEASLKSCPYETSAYCGGLPVKFNGTANVFPRAMFENYVDLPFEDASFRAFARWDDYLKQEFGDYMQLPPENKRFTHHLEVYRLD